MSRFKVPEDVDGIAIDGVQFPAEQASVVVDGKATKVNTVKVPDTLDHRVTICGYPRFSIPEKPGRVVNATTTETAPIKDAGK